MVLLSTPYTNKNIKNKVCCRREHKLSTWSFQVKVLSKWTPRYWYELTWSICVSCMTTETWSPTDLGKPTLEPVTYLLYFTFCFYLSHHSRVNLIAPCKCCWGFLQQIFWIICMVKSKYIGILTLLKPLKGNVWKMGHQSVSFRFLLLLLCLFLSLLLLFPPVLVRHTPLAAWLV